MKNQFIKKGFSVIETENSENKLLAFWKENYPSVIKDNEIDLNELKAIAGLPIDEKVNGYGEILNVANMHRKLKWSFGYIPK